ncbi:MAG: DNA polymerase I [Planctomycetes bacterium]|nr:DNA polymerase I [Planctomycetota bacterium]
MKTFYIIDGHAQIFRAYYAPFRPLTSPAGEPTKAVYVFTQMVLGILRDKKPDYLAVALDTSDSTTERRSYYPEYKTNRETTPEDLPAQIDRIVEILEAMEIPIFRVEGQEADDIIATVAERFRDEDIELRIVSRDKDLHQLLTDRVKLWDPMKDRLIDARGLEETLGYTPAEAVEIQTLTGDSTDNVPGITGIGPKKALDLIKKYGTAEGVVEHAGELTPKMRENVLKERGILETSRRLVTLNRRVKLDLDLERCALRPPRPEKLAPIFEELGFRSLLDGLAPGGGATGRAGEPGARGANGTAKDARYERIDTPEKLDGFLARLRDVKRFAIDTETTSLSAADCDLVGLSFSWKAGEAFYLPVRSRKGDALDPDRTVEALRPILEDPAVEKCGQNIKFDIVVLAGAGIALRGVVFDSMVASYLLFPDRRSHGMDAMARDFLGHQTIPITEVIGTGKDEISMLDADPDILTRYAAEDADITWRLHEHLAPLIEESSIKPLFHDVEMPLVDVLAHMEYSGVAIDEKRLKKISKSLGRRIEKLVEEIHDVAGHEFSIDSPKQLAGVLFDEQGLRVVKKTKTSRSTDASVLQTLAGETAHPLPRLVLEYRELAKLRSTYVDPLPSLVSKKTGRIHASFHQTVTATGRLSSSDPNLQNIPIRTEQGREIRKAFVPGSREDVLITADYSQIELRILAHLSKDPGLREAFAEDRDIHAFVASQIYGVPLEKVTKQQRTRAKAVNFGIIYGQGAFGLAQSLSISRGEAAEFIRKYKERYAGIAGFVEECVARAEKDGYVTTMLGRRRPIPEARSQNRAVRAQGERLAVNTVVQGSAADMIKVAMVRIHERIRAGDLPLRLLIQVHDELVFESPRRLAEAHAELAREEMVRALPLDVPLKVDVAWGDNWLEGKES